MRDLEVHETFRRRARAALPRMIFDYLEGGADGELGLKRNRDAFRRIALKPRRLVDVSARDPSTTLFGRRVAMPVAIAPTGLNGVLWPNGDIALARAAGKAGVPFALSTASTNTIEDVAKAASGDLWFQLYVIHRDIADALIRRARDAGYSTLVLTTDVIVNGRRPRELRHGFKVPFRVTPWTALQFASRPRWLGRQLGGGLPQLANFNTMETTLEAQAALMARRMDASFSWEDLQRLRDDWPGTLLVKGVLRASDARRCFDIGADGVILSNHGGRQLDAAAAPISILAQEFEGADLPVLIDSGVRDAGDCAKALALGAQAVLLGRLALYGLAAAGEAGVDEVLETFRLEFDRSLALLGAPSPDALDRSFVSDA